MAQVRRKYEVHEVEEEARSPRLVTKIAAPSKAKKAGGRRKSGFDVEEVKDDRPQYDVYFPNGNSIRIVGDDELHRLGFHVGAGLVDMETGEDIDDMPQRSLKELAERKTQGPRINV